MTTIFLSYGRGDDEPFVKRLYEDLTAHGHEVWWDRVSMPSRGRTFNQEIRDAIDGCERLLLVVGPHALASDYVRAEWDHALEVCKAVTPVLRLGDYPQMPPELAAHHSPDARPERSEAEALAEIRRVVAEPIPPLGVLHAVPALPAHFLPRVADLETLNDTVLADMRGPTVITSAQQTTTLQGMGGVGKSVLAAAFCRACGTRRAFGDGIVWVTVGQEPDLVRTLTTAGRVAGDDVAEYVDLARASARLGQALADKNLLLVLDDVWDVGHAEPFANATGARCRLLVTTRDGGLASALGAQEHRLDLLDLQASLQLLADWSRQAEEGLPDTASEVAAECGYLPFALALCGAMARDGAPWSDLLDALREADLAFLQKQFPNYPYPDVLRALKVSVDALARSDPEWARHYGELAVFPAAEPVPEAAVVQLWVYTNGLKERSARQLLTTLGRKSLLHLEGEAPDRRVALHDLQHDYLRAALHDLTGLHGELLAAYKEKSPEGWHTGPDDGYFFQRLVWHLAQAGRGDELRDLLLDYRWMRAKLGASGPAPLIADYDQAHSAPADGPARGRTLDLVQGALRLSAHVIGPDPAQLPSQLTGRLLGTTEGAIRELLAQVRRETKTPWLRPLALSLTPPGGALLRTLRGHTRWVRAVAVTPDGRRAVSGSDDNTLKVWDLETGAELRTLRGHTEWVWAVALTADGRRAVSGSYEGELKVWDLESGAELRTLHGHTGSVNAVAVTPDGRRAVSGSHDKTLKVWDLETGAELRTLRGHTGSVDAVAVTPDGRRAVSGSHDETLRVWDLETGVELRTLRGHTSSVSAVAVTPDGRRAVSGSWDKTLKVWDLETGAELAVLRGRTGLVSAVAVTPGGRRAVSASDDGTLKVWDLETGAELAVLRGHTNEVSAVAVMPDGRRAVSGSWDKTLKVWDISAAIPSTGFGTGNAGLEMGEELAALRGHTRQVSAVAVTPDGRRAVSGSKDKTLKVWDLETGEVLHTLCAHVLEVCAVAVMPDGRRAVSGANLLENTLKVWDLEAGAELPTLHGNPSSVSAVAVTPDGRRVVSGPDYWKLKVWDLETGAELVVLRGHTLPVGDVAVTPDGRRAVSGSWDKTLKVWDLDTGAELLTLRGHTREVSAVAVTPDGRRAVSGSWDRTLKVWDLQTGAELRTLRGHTDRVNDVAVTPDGRRAVSVSWDHALKVWDISAALPSSRLGTGDAGLETGAELATFIDKSHLRVCAVGPDGATFVAGGDSGHVHFLRLENVATGPAVLTAWVESHREVQQNQQLPAAPRWQFWRQQPVLERVEVIESSFAFGCAHCRSWSEVPESALGSQIPCPNCGKQVKLNRFAIDADWRPVAAAWRGEPLKH